MPSTVEQLSPTRVKIVIEVPFDELKPSMDKAYREVARTISIPGFRRGKVPPMVIDQRVGRGTIIQEALNDALPQFYGAAVEENKLNPLSQPQVEVTKLEDGELVEFTAEVDIRPDFTTPDLTQVAVTVDAIEVPDEAVQEQIEGLRQRFGSRQAVERAAESGDVVTIDLVATKDGESLEDATAEGIEYEVGSGSMLDGLDEAVTGLGADESADFTSVLVGGPRKDEEADIKVTVTKVQTQELPEVDDEFAQLASEFDTVDELKADLASRLTNIARLEQAAQARDAVLETLLGQLEIELPPELLQADITARREQISGQLDAASLTLEDYLAENEEEGATPEEFWANLEVRTTDALKAQLVLDQVAQEKEVSVGQDDLTQHIIRMAQRDQTNPQQIAEHLQEHPHHIDEYMMEIRRGKALALIVESAQVTDSNGDKVDIAGLNPDGTLGAAEDDLGQAEVGDTDTEAAEETAEETKA